jgi:hypothetical protein
VAAIMALHRVGAALVLPRCDAQAIDDNGLSNRIF